MGLAIVTSILGFGQPASASSLNNFIISDYQVDMSLTRDDEGRSRLATTETITAVFPDFDQNHGIERSLVDSYDDHTTSLKVESVTDANGQPWNYKMNDNNILRIGDGDKYLHGEQTFIIKYSQRDVTKFFEDVGVDEFYWDVIGTEWLAPIEQATIRLQIDPKITNSIQTEFRCYAGSLGSTDSCLVSNQDDAMVINVANLSVGQGVTVAIGFQKGTFNVYQPTPWELFTRIWSILQMATSLLIIPILGWLSILYLRSTGRKKELGTIVPEYIPPEDVSLIASARIGGNYSLVLGSPMTAQLIDLAVRHYIKIYEIKKSSFFGYAEYEIEIVGDLSTLKAEERELIEDMFDVAPKVGDRVNLKKLRMDQKYVTRVADDRKKINDLVENQYNLLEEGGAHRKRFRRYTIVFLVLAILLLSLPMLIVVITAFAMSYGKSLTDKGLALRRYLMGLKMYIGVAEAERLKMLQSPEGAEKVGQVVDGNNKGQLVKLYERVLPYAILFGQEKGWNKQIGQYYEQAGARPDWYSGIGAFNAASFASGMQGLGSSVVSTGSSYSSSSGGSGGGGFSGGGGGGGGGGGW